MPKKIIIIRHGQTDYNQEKRVQGWLDIPLNQTGLEQAKKLAEHLIEEVIDHIYTSDLKRALQTALPIAKLKKLKLKKTKKLRERDLGDFTNKQGWEIEAMFPSGVTRAGELTDQQWQQFNAESSKDLIIRIKSFFKYLQKSHQNEIIAVVTHGGLKRNILRWLGLGKYLETGSLENTSITILEKDQNGKYKITTFASTNHL